MFCHKFSIKMLKLTFLGFFATIVMPMAPRIPTMQYIPTAVQLGLRQQADVPVAPELSRVQISPETMRRVQAELMESEQQPAQQQVWTIQKMRPAYVVEQPRYNEASRMFQPEQKSLQKKDTHQRFAGAGSSSGIFKATAPQLMSRQEAHKILGVTEQASSADKKAAYRELVKKYHPDIAGAVSTAKMQELQKAYEIVSQKPGATGSSDQQTSDVDEMYRQAQQRGYTSQEDPDYLWETGMLGGRQVRRNKPLDIELGLAIKANNIEKAESLIKQGANLNIIFVGLNDPTDTESWIKGKIFHEGQTPLELAATNLDMLKMLLRLGATKGLDMALRRAAVENESLIVDFLLEKGAKPTESAAIFSIMNNWFPSKTSRADIVEKLVRAGAVVDHKALYQAFDSTHPEIIEGFAKAGVKIPKNEWKEHYIKANQIPIVLQYGALEGLTPRDVRSWYVREKAFIDKLNRGTLNESFFLHSGQSVKLDAQKAIKAMEQWFAARNEPIEESYLQAALRKASEIIFGKK